MITVSAGGNNIGLSSILDSCIFKWSGGALNPYNGKSCSDTIADSQSIVDNRLSACFNTLYAAVIPKLGTDPAFPDRPYVTGYAQFFNPDTTGCNDQTWSFWYNTIGKQYLTQGLRMTLNNMVDAVNSKISDAVAAAGDQVVFVNYDQYFTKYGGRYCENNTTEPDASQMGLMFYE